jgi:pyruvate dehydrogenase E2 component (dihydrolipoamide acetyltransferase)
LLLGTLRPLQALQCQRAKGLATWTPSKMPSWRATHLNYEKSSKHVSFSRLPAILMASSAPIEVKMPALSSTMKEGKIVSWAKKVGDKVNSGDVLLVVESDKADMDVESFDEGFLAKVFVPEGGVAEVGSVVALMATSEDAVSSVAAAAGGTSKASAAVAPVDAVERVPVPSKSASQASDASSSPMPSECRVIKMPALSSTMKEGKIVAWR